MFSTIATICLSAVVFCSFAGLCAQLRVRLGIHCCVAPLVTASGIVIALTFAGSLNALPIACDALYVLGIASLAQLYLFKKLRPPKGLLLMALIFLALLVWRFSDCCLRHFDDFSHWGTVTRFLLVRNRLPVESDAALTHQSYPPGTACFIYYCLKPIGFRENGCLVAQNFLHGVALLPMLGCVRKRDRATLAPVALLMGVAFMFYTLHDVDLLVDSMQAFFGIGIAAAIFLYRDDPRRATLCAVPPMIAVALFKNSGLFFSAVSALMLLLVLRRRGAGRRAWTCALIGLALPIAAYLLWSLRVRLSFPSGNMGGHAISIAAYSKNLQEKGLAGAFSVVQSMARSLLDLGGWRVGIVALALGALAVTFCVGRRLPRLLRREIRDALLFALGSYALWLVMLFAMYVFSMGGKVALQASSFTRYNVTGYSYAAGILALVMLFALQRAENPFPAKLMRAASAASALILACSIALMLIPGVQTPLDGFIAREQKSTYVHSCLEDAQARGNVPYAGRCLFFFLYDEDSYFRSYGYTRNSIRYRFGSDDQALVTAERNEAGQLRIMNQSAEPDAVRDYIAENLQDCQAVVLLDPSEEFEAALDAALDESGREIPVCREYELFAH